MHCPHWFNSVTEVKETENRRQRKGGARNRLRVVVVEASNLEREAGTLSRFANACRVSSRGYRARGGAVLISPEQLRL